MSVHIASDRLQDKRQRKWAVDKQVTMAFNITSVVSIKVDEMGIERKSGIAEEKGTSRSEGMRKVGLARRCTSSVVDGNWYSRYPRSKYLIGTI